MFKERANKKLMFNIPKLFTATIINLNYILDKIKVSYTINKKENPLLRKKDRLLKL